MQHFVMWVSDSHVAWELTRTILSNKWLSDFDLQASGGSGDACAWTPRVASRPNRSTASPPLCTQEDGGLRAIHIQTYIYIRRYVSVADTRTREAAERNTATASDHKSKAVKSPLKVSISRYWPLSTQRSNTFHVKSFSLVP
jgi:hypothetical protein